VPVSVPVAVEQLLAALEGFDPASVAPSECAALLEQLARVEKACGAARVAVAVQAGARPADVAKLAGTSSAAASRDLATVRALGRLPLAAAAVAAGELSLTQAYEIASTVAEDPGAEPAMVATAKTQSLQVLRDVGRATRMAAIDTDVLRTKQVAARSHRQWTDELGMVRYSGAMLPEHGTPFARRVDVATDRAWRAARRRGPVEATREQLAADAFADIVTGGGRAHPTRADVVYVCDVNSGATKIVGGGPVPRAVFDEAARDGFVKAVLHDGTRIDTVVHYGRKALPAVLRTALELGEPPGFDGVRCVDCGRLLGLQVDHVDPVANDGPTCLGNLRHRCCTCHPEKTARDREAGLLGRARGQPP